MSSFNSVFKKIPVTEINPKGWLNKQLNIQANGLSGHIDEIWDDLSVNSAWLNGKGEAWERGPYYIDGLITLAYLEKDEKLILKVKKWIDCIINSQKENGDFGPVRNPDWWPRMVVLKAFVNYYKATEDNRIIPFMLKYLKYEYSRLDEFPPEYWASSRALEAYEAIEMVYDLTKEEFLFDLIKKLKGYMYNWFGYFNNFKYTKPMNKYFNKTIFNLGRNILAPIDKILKARQGGLKIKSREQILKFNNSKSVSLITFTHGVNIAMAYKYPVSYGAAIGDKSLYEITKKGYDNLMKIHGTGIGIHTSDEHLMGTSPSQGIELCTVVEEMYSWEECLRLTGDITYADKLEYLAYNALPATFSDDMCSHQYVQQPNQIDADRKKRQFFDTDNEANTFGLAPNFGCCAANMHQGFPKFVSNLVYKDDNGLTFMLYGPCNINTKINNKPFSLSEETEYPFNNQIKFTVNEATDTEISLTFRKPLNYDFTISFNDGEIKSDNQERTVTIKKVFKKDDKIVIDLKPLIKVVKNSDDSISILRGCLLFALYLNYNENYVRGDKPFHYREYVHKGDWNYAPVIKDNGLKIKKIIENPVSDNPFSSKEPSLKLIVEGRKISNWNTYKNSAASVPVNPEKSDLIDITLVPYGSTKLRIAQFPKID